MVPTISEVEALSSTSWDQLTDTKKQELLDIAEREADQIHGGQVSRFSIIEGDKDDFIKHLAAHKWELATGGETQSESSGGGNVSYNTVTGDINSYLSQTRYGRDALGYLRDRTGSGIVST